MLIELIDPQLFDFTGGRDRFKIRLREADAPGRCWVSLTYTDVDRALAAMRGVVTALEEVKANPRRMEYHGTTPPPEALP